MDAAIKHCTAGLGIWEWASNDQGSDPDVVMACAGDVIDRVPDLGSRTAYGKQYIRDKLTDHRTYTHRYGQDMPEIRDWSWGSEETGQPKERK
jgi:phosphoketolase